jgi:hypothetical protein
MIGEVVVIYDQVQGKWSDGYLLLEVITNKLVIANCQRMMQIFNLVADMMVLFIVGMPSNNSGFVFHVNYIPHI